MPVEELPDPVEDLVATIADLKARVEGLERAMAALKQPERVETHEPGEDPPTVHGYGPDFRCEPWNDDKRFEEKDFA